MTDLEFQPWWVSAVGVLTTVGVVALDEGAPREQVVDDIARLWPRLRTACLLVIGAALASYLVGQMLVGPLEAIRERQRKRGNARVWLRRWAEREGRLMSQAKATERKRTIRRLQELARQVRNEYRENELSIAMAISLDSVIALSVERRQESIRVISDRVVAFIEELRASDLPHEVQDQMLRDLYGGQPTNESH